MSADNRTVTTDALETLGLVHFRKEKRDAIHLAVLPVIAGEVLKPASHVKVVDGKAFACKPKDAIGIVDPFLLKDLIEGDTFWYVVKPRLITSLRHVWEHPAFPNEE